MPLMDRTVEERQKAEGMTCSKGPSDAGLEPGPTAAKTVASIHGAPSPDELVNLLPPANSQK